MLRVVLQVLLLLGMLWYQKHDGYRWRPATLTVVWYAVGVFMILVESKGATGSFLDALTLQAMAVALFYVPPAFLAFRRAGIDRKGIKGPFMLYIGLAVVATLLAALVLARAPIAQGLV
jgi:hypothetical protein